MASNKRVIGKVLWCAVVLVCLGFSTRQIYLLCDQYARNTLVTMISIRQQTVSFPDISFCNLNPFSFYRIKSSYLSYMENTSFDILGQFLYYPYEEDALFRWHKTEINNLAVGFSEAFHQVINRDRRLRHEMRTFSDESDEIILQQIRNLNPDIGFVCSIFDEHYGLCYRFSSDSKVSQTSGPLFALQLVIDVNQSDYLPNITRDAGIRVSVHKSRTEPFLQNSGISVATSLQTDISLLQKTVERFPDRTRCDKSNQFNDIQKCFEHCKLEYAKRMCDCSHELVDDDGRQLICYVYDAFCVADGLANLTKCNCLSPCRETKYEKTVTTSRWPARNFEPFLEELYGMRGLNYSDYKDSLLAVNIYLESLSEEVITEEPAFTRENLMSNIGGALGLWIGMSIISVGEIIELTWMLCSTALKRRRIDTTVPQSNDTTVAQSGTTVIDQSDKTAVA